MSITIVEGNLLDAKEIIICHQVNCQGRMGSGVAKAIKNKWPEAYSSYLDHIEIFKNRKPILGTVDFAPVGEGDNMKTICNMFAQDRYGYDGKTYTSYDAFRSCLAEINRVVAAGIPIAMPYKIGCGLGGGDWEIIYKMIEKEMTDHDVVLYKLEEKK